MAGVIAKWQDGTATLLYLELADAIAIWQDVKAHINTVYGRCCCQTADVIATVYLCDGRCYSQVADRITTQIG